MKRVILLALLVTAGATLNTASAQSKKKKKNKEQCEAQMAECCKAATIEKVTLNSTKDSISYAAGMSMTRGLEGYVMSQLGVKKEEMPEFIRGLKEGIAKRNDANFAPYTAGLQIANQVDKTMLQGLIKQFEGTANAIDADMLYKGFVAALEKDSTLFKQANAEQYFQGKQQAVKAEKEAAIKAEGEKFLAENKKQAGVVTLPSGLQYKVITQGNGPIPKADDRVNVAYEGRTLDGKIFDATERHGTEYDTFGVSGLIKGWTEALTLMPVGSTWTLYIPSDLAYGARGAGEDIAPYATLVFTLSLKGIEPKEQPKPSLNVGEVKKSAGAQKAKATPAKGKTTATKTQAKRRK